MAVQETRFEALGRSWTFKFGFAAMCRLERHYDQPFGEIIADMLPGLKPEMLKDPVALAAAASSLRFDHLASIVQAGLNDGEVTAEIIAEIIDALGIEAALAVIFAANENDVTGGPAPKKAPARRPGGASRKR
jgi:hypothetical protein